jgi:uncharacterized membrane protein
MPRALTRMWRTSAVFFASLLIVFSLAPAASAQYDEYGISSFDAEIVVNQDGTFDVTETIQGEFFVQKHGIFRNIPVKYRHPLTGIRKSITIDVDHVWLDGKPVPYQILREGGQQVLKIGDPNRTMDGLFTYEIAYTVKRAMLHHDLTDELYWNVTGDEWDVPIPSSSAVVFVDDVDEDEFDVSCYTGMMGSTEQACGIGTEPGAAAAAADDFLTVSVQFPKGHVVEPSSSTMALWWLEDNWDALTLLLPILMLLFLIVVWLRYGRDEKGRGTIIARYEPPEDMLPTEVGTLVDAKLHNMDFAAAIVDLAVRGYMRIEEEGKKGFISSVKYKFYRLDKSESDLRSYEKTILKAIFGESKETELRARRNNLQNAWRSVDKKIYEDLVERGYYTRNPKTLRNLFVGVGTVVLFGGFFLFANMELIFLMISSAFIGIELIAFSGLMPKRTAKGTEAYEHAKGFKMFLETAEKYRIEWQEKEGIFEKYLPYAMVFGVAKKWAKAFEGLEGHEAAVGNPTWYRGNFAFAPLAFTNSVSSFLSSASTASTPSSSGGGGGGGFSGGGFGGGGGGSW